MSEPNDGERSDDTDESVVVRYKFASQFIRPTDHVLDVSCGEGLGTAVISRYAELVEGIDYSETAINIAKEKYVNLKNVKFFRDDAEQLNSQKDQSKDLIVSLETIEHVRHAETFVRRCKDILKPNCLFLLSTPNDFWSNHTNKWHIHEFKPDELFSLLSNQGFEVEKYWGSEEPSVFKKTTQRYRGMINSIPLGIRKHLGGSMFKRDTAILETQRHELNKFLTMFFLARKKLD